MSQTPELMRQQNRAVILATIQEQGPISRVEIATLLGLNPATITRITRDLLDEGLIQEEGEGESKGAGRKRVLLTFNHGARLVVGIQAEGKQITGVIANLASQILTRRTTLITSRLTPLLTALLDDLLDEDPSYRQRIAAVTLGINNADRLDLPTLERRYHVPFTTAPSAMLAAIAEAEIGAMTEQPAFVLFYLGSESSSCLYLNGQTRVGQFGWNRGARPISEIACDDGLIAIFNLLTVSDTPSTLTNARVRPIFEAARRGDPVALKAIEFSADELALAAEWFAPALNLDHIVIAGAWLRDADVLIPVLQKRISQPLILPAKLGSEAALIGAVRMAIRIADRSLQS